jgi:AraC-like DNA-binding protein
MKYTEIIPGTGLKQHVKCFYIYESDSAISFDDTVFPSGCVEIIFNLGTGKWQTAMDDGFQTTPSIELWGQIIRPMPIRSIGRNTMLGIRFFPHAAAYFLNDNIGLFNNRVVDYSEVGKGAAELHSRLLEASAWDQRIKLVEAFLLHTLSISEKGLDRVDMLTSIMGEIRHQDFFDNIENVASRYGITSRYLQKLFFQYTGLSPKLYTKIHRFQNSLRLVTKKDTSLTSVAYHCGYFDQSHFIREFKSFTGLTPSGYSVESSPITLAFANN